MTRDYDVLIRTFLSHTHWLSSDMMDSLYVVGGAVRDARVQHPVRDWDIVWDGPCLPEIQVRGLRRNTFGGIKIRDGAVTWDFWPLADTWAIRRRGISARPEAFTQTTVFNVDSGIVSPSTGQSWDDLVVQGLRDRRLDLSLAESLLMQNPTPHLNVAKAFWLRAVYGLQFSPAVDDYIAWVLHDGSAALRRVWHEALRHRYHRALSGDDLVYYTGNGPMASERIHFH